MSQEDRDPFDYETRDLIVAMLILKGSNHDCARKQLQQQFALGTHTEDTFPNTEDKAIVLIDSIDRNNNGNNNSNNNKNGDGAVVAAHSTDYDYCSDDDSSDDELIVSTNHEEEADEATLLANVEEDGPTGPSSASISNNENFRATILANAVAEYDDDLQEVEDGFVNRTNNQQDVNDAFDDNEPEALAVDDDFAVVNSNSTIQVLESSVDEDTSNDN
jgi:hypothetical protein